MMGKNSTSPQVDASASFLAPSVVEDSQVVDPQVIVWIWMQKRLDSSAYARLFDGRPNLVVAEIRNSQEAMFVQKSLNLLISDRRLSTEREDGCGLRPFVALPESIERTAVLFRPRPLCEPQCGCCQVVSQDISPDRFWNIVQGRLELLRSPQGVPTLHRQSDCLALNLLSEREFEAFRLLATGIPLQVCADRMQVTICTMENYKYRVMRKMRLRKSQELYVLGARLGWLSPLDWQGPAKPHFRGV